MNYRAFLNLVKEFLNRDELDNRIPEFVEAALLRLQRRHNFQFSRKSTTMSYPSSQRVGVTLPTDFKAFVHDHSVSLISGATYLPLMGVQEKAEMAREHRTAYQSLDASGVASTIVGPTSRSTSPIRYYTKVFLSDAVTRRRTNIAQETKLFLSPEQPGASLYVEYFAWLPMYTSATDEDIFLIRGHDILLWETLAVANIYLHEEDRVGIDAQATQRALQEFLEWDSRSADSGAGFDLE